MSQSPTKLALLERWLQGKQPVSATPVIPRRAENAPLTISLPQQRHLFLELLDPGTSVNNLPVLLRLSGALDIASLEKSANQIIARHEVLRTRFSFGMGVPAASMVKELSIRIPVIKTTGEAEAMQWAGREVKHPFDLLQAPLMRLKLYQFERDKFFLLIIVHHTIADGWSLGVFVKELMLFYQSNRKDLPVHLPDLLIQYADYAAWQSGEKQAGALLSSLGYWKEQLRGELPVLELPTDRARGSKQTFNGSTHHFVISAQLTEAIEALSRNEDATLFMSLLAAFYLMLHRFSGQHDILVGSPIANRNLPELDNLIGVFINTLVLRAQFSGDPSFRQLLQQVRTTSLEAYAHQDFPYEKLVEELKPKRGLNRPPLFQVVFNLQNSPLPDLKIDGLETEFLEIDRAVSQFDITLMVSKKKGECNAIVEYNSDLFLPETITRMFGFYQQCLEFFSVRPDASISSLSMISEAEQHHLLQELNNTFRDFPQEKTVSELIKEQAEKTPEAVAIIHDEQRVTYGDLNKRVDMLAGYLQTLGAAPEVRIGIFMQKSFETLVALLAVLRAGGAYVPIHISTPPERIEFILRDAGVQVLLTNIEDIKLEKFDGKIVNLFNENIETNGANIEDLATPDNLAYIMYTSGSTGEPKGVMVNHSSLLNFLSSMREMPGMDENSVVLALASLSFDPSTLELLLPLMVGGRVVIASERMATDPLLIAETINRQGVNVLQATPATWQLLLDTNWSGKADLKALCGGDILTKRMAGQLLERVGSLWNMYGPTETTVWSTCGQVRRNDLTITIGQPVDNAQIYILDNYLQMVPPGVTGELHIAGAGLARAYLNNPELTNQKFIANPFDGRAGGRMYKSGDLARYLPDYKIEILGRSDDQVKVSGHRMELGEIISVLKQHPAVKDGIVITRTETGGDKRLLAYYVPQFDSPASPENFREFFGKKLPDYMIPSFFISVHSLPLTANGKIDRKSLPLPEDVLQPGGYLAPRNEEEQMLATIWQNVLHIERVGIHDNFFDLGGASIQSIQIVARANMYGYKISVDNIFEYQTVAALADYISRRDTSSE